jgi:hypothetical protein
MSLTSVAVTWTVKNDAKFDVWATVQYATSLEAPVSTTTSSPIYLPAAQTVERGLPLTNINLKKPVLVTTYSNAACTPESKLQCMSVNLPENPSKWTMNLQNPVQHSAWATKQSFMFLFLTMVLTILLSLAIMAGWHTWQDLRNVLYMRPKDGAGKMGV